MDTYSVAVLTGDLSKPLIRQTFESMGKLTKYLEKQNENTECSVITFNDEQNKVFFGSIKNFLKSNNEKL